MSRYSEHVPDYKGLEALRNHLKSKNLELKPRPHAPNRVYSNKQLFEEMERVWKLVGQRPSRDEWDLSKPRIAYNTYKQRFGGWTNACLRFIEYKMGDAILSDDFVISDREVEYNQKTSHEKYNPQNTRSIPLSLRLAVLSRDNFRCVFCGRSPATDFGTKLHIDHVVPFSNGGKSVLENLQTLCEDCNLGKSNKNVQIRT